MSDYPARWSFASQIFVMDSDGTNAQQLTNTFEAAPVILGWTADSQHVVFMEAFHTSSRLYSVNSVDHSITLLLEPAGTITNATITDDGKHVGLILQSLNVEAAAFAIRLDDLNLTRISPQPECNRLLPEIRTELIRWQSSDQYEIEGLLTYPVNYIAGTRVPLLLIVHGGPAGVFLQTYIGNPGIYCVAAFANKGYAVLRCNPRGSSGYGESFRSANRSDWGGGDYVDLMTGVDRVIEMGVADPDRLGVMGWSYGGYMTAWITTQTHRFKAASVGAGVTNLTSFNGTADIPSFVPDYFEAQSWQNPELYAARSPIHQIASAATPTLIVHGDADIRVPITQGYELYSALRQKGVATKMLVLPRQPHVPNEPKMMLKNMQATLDWFEEQIPV